ncbi:MAG: CBS domain-containing protein [Actinomycetota bacterium]
MPIARLGETVGDAKSRVDEAELDLCLVVNAAGIFMGRLRGESLEVEPATPVEQAMEHGSSTVRPNEPYDALASRMSKRKIGSVVVSDLKGRLIGVLFAG